jgi:peroxiredoxin
MKNLLFITVLFFSVPTFAQNNFTFSPEKPQAGDVITINYTPSGAIANTTSPLNAIVYTMRNNEEHADDMQLKKSGNNYVGTVKTDTADNFAFFSFSADGNYDINSNNGYWIRLYEGDKFKKSANMNLAAFYEANGRNTGIDRDYHKALKYMNEEFKLYPEAKKKRIILYSRLYAIANKDSAQEFLETEIEATLKTGLKNENDYTILQDLYRYAKLPEQAKLINDLKEAKFPEGQWKINETVNNFLREKDMAKKEAMFNEISSKIKNDSAWKFLEPSLSYFRSSIPNAYYQKQDWNGMDAAIKKLDIKGMELASLYNNAAWEIQKTNKNLDKADKMAATAVEIAKKEWKNPSGKKPDYLSESQWEKSRASAYAMYADTYGMVNFKEGNFKKGLPYSEDAALKIHKGKTAEGNNTYALLAEKALPARKYVPQLEQFVKDGKATSSIKDILKRAYEKKHKSDNGYEEYMAALQHDAYVNTVAGLKKEMLSGKEPKFTLVDLKGNKINIEDLKNKVVVVDFWATWCGPCKASFPGMQKAVTKFKNDPDVKFVFVDTWETSDNKEKNAADFIAKNNYDFHVLMDNDSKVVEQFKVEGIPTKFVIDKNGIIRFKEVGFDGSDDKLITELSAMIDVAKTM